MKKTKIQNVFTFATDDQPIIRGRLHGYDTQLDEDLVLLASLIVPKMELQEQKEISIRPDGTFELKMAHSIGPRQIWLKTGAHYFGELRFSKEITVTIDLNTLRKGQTQYYAHDSVIFSGPDSTLTHYVNQHNTNHNPKLEQLNDEITKTLFDRKIPPEEKLPIMRRQQEASMTLLKEFIQENPSEHAKALLNDELSDFYGRILAIYFIAKQAMSEALLQEVLAHEPHQLTNEGVDYYRHFCFYLMTTFKRRAFPSFVFIDQNGNYQPDVVSRISSVDFAKVSAALASDND